MRILWYVNVIMPKAASGLSLKSSIGGGWLEAQAYELIKNENIKLTIVNITTAVKTISCISVEGIEYILLPISEYIKTFRNTFVQLNPDIVHVHGTEYIYNTDIISLLSKTRSKFVVSVQGLMHQTAQHYCDGLPSNFEKINPFVKFMGKVFYSDSIAVSKKKFELQGQQEINAIRITNNVIGRTEWDKSSILKINRKIKYFHVNENLRDSFYDSDQWCYEDCTKLRIFVSQGFYPIKGLHNLLTIMPRLIKRFPNITVVVGGQQAYTLNSKILDYGVDYFFEYQAYIKQLIKVNKLEKYVNFIGPLNQEQMKRFYLNCNLFLSCSTIENSPNSVAEAMILGVPIVASNVGGTGSLLSEGEGLLYKSLDSDDMYQKIVYAFENNILISNMAIKAREHALITHDRSKNTKDLLMVYDNVVTGEKG